MTQELKVSETIHNILLHEWDPIGVASFKGAEDEYDLYIADLINLLRDKSTEQDFFNFLWWVETEHMGLSGDRELTKKVASKIACI